MKQVVVVGHICLDLIPTFDAPPSIEPGRLIGVGPISLAPGGSAGNTGPALVALGVPTRLVVDAGSDDLGRVLISLLTSAAVDISGIARIEGLGTSYSVVVDMPGRDRTFWHHIGANAAFDGRRVLDLLAGAADTSDVILHLGYPTHLPALYAHGGDALVRLVTGAASAGATVSIDTAEIDPTSEAGKVEWEGVLARTLPGVDVMKSSVDDLVAMLPQRRGAEPIAWADAVVGLGAAVAVVTSGAGGLYVRTAPAARFATAARALRVAVEDWADRELWVPPLAIEVLATTGAGDSAAAGFLAGLSDGRGVAECALLSAAAAAARISGRPIGDAYEMAATGVFAGEPPAGWTLGADRIYHGPHDRIG
ncbi:MAG TPA: PfkB family carbohydrate kinase [Candidatus Limnocylindrales bacterium]